ncbi:Flagellar basal-body rod protein, FlgC [Enterobacter hormaechei]|nr:Flagellar basal-body rod protein, FlgC [Enterobacter hormaechei]VAE03065.1 Flagellar basal-body rod protein, FlgC [Enterobacter hormaechei]VAF64393.1 Flagellar basal-body rod protein, FlgC [Enterobacter hormaechei]
MSLFSVFDISGSAMAAQSKRLNVSASNMANADSVAGPDGQPYRARQVMFEADTSAG